MSAVGALVIGGIVLILVLQALDFSYYGNVLGILTVVATLIWMKKASIRFKQDIKDKLISKKSFWILVFSQAVICVSKNLIVPSVADLNHRVAFIWRYSNRFCYYIMLTVGTFFIVCFIFSLVQRRIALAGRTEIKCVDIAKSQEFLGVVGILIAVLLLSFLRNRPVVFVNAIKAGFVYIALIALNTWCILKTNVKTSMGNGAYNAVKIIWELLNKK